MKMMAFSAEMAYFGPIPPPHILKGFEDLLPGATDRILKMAEKQSTHRMAIESKVIAGDSYRAKIGLWLGFVVALVLIIGGLIVIERGHDTAGAAVISSSLIGVVGTFIYGQYSRRQEREQRRSQEAESSSSPTPKASTPPQITSPKSSETTH